MKNGDSREGIQDIPIVAFGSRAHLEKKALATVSSLCLFLCFIFLFLFSEQFDVFFRGSGIATF